MNSSPAGPMAAGPISRSWSVTPMAPYPPGRQVRPIMGLTGPAAQSSQRQTP